MCEECINTKIQLQRHIHQEHLQNFHPSKGFHHIPGDQHDHGLDLRTVISNYTWT